MAECRARAQEVLMNHKPVIRIAGAVIVGIWVAAAAALAVWAYGTFLLATAQPC